MSLHLLGAEPLRDKVTPPPELSRGNLLVSLGGAFAGMLLWPKHWVLGLLGGSSLAGNVHAVVTKQRPWKLAVRRVGCQVVAAGTSLALPSHPALGWMGGAIAAELLIDGEGRGLLEEWAHHAGVREEDPKILDGEIVTDPQKQTATALARRAA